MTNTPSVEGDRLEQIAADMLKQLPFTKAYLTDNGINPHFADVLLSHYYGFAQRVSEAALPCKEPQPLSTEDFLAKVADLSPAQYKALIFGNAAKLAEAGITREWFERKATLEGDLEVGAGWSVADALPRKGGEAEDRPCNRCQGNGEIITDWPRYLGPSQACDQGDEGTSDCPDCNGTGRVDAAPSTEPDTGRGLREALDEAFAVLVLMERPPLADPQHQKAVNVLGERIGYGALMHAAQYGWREMLRKAGHPEGAEFVVGPCQMTVAATLATVRQALAALTDTTPASEAADHG